MVEVNVRSQVAAGHGSESLREMVLYSNSDRCTAAPLFLGFHYSSMVWLRETFVTSPPFVALVPPGNYKGERESMSHSNSVLPVTLP
jgi:hypothetical protein